MKIDEPKTPYEYASGIEDDEKEEIDESSGNGGCVLDSNLLAERYDIRFAIQTIGPRLG